MYTLNRSPAAFYECLITVVIELLRTTATQKNILYYPLVDIEHGILVESEKETIIDFFNSLGISPATIPGKPFSNRKSLCKRNSAAITENSLKL